MVKENASRKKEIRS